MREARAPVVRRALPGSLPLSAVSGATRRHGYAYGECSALLAGLSTVVGRAEIPGSPRPTVVEVNKNVTDGHADDSG